MPLYRRFILSRMLTSILYRPVYMPRLLLRFNARFLGLSCSGTGGSLLYGYSGLPMPASHARFSKNELLKFNYSSILKVLGGTSSPFFVLFLLFQSFFFRNSIFIPLEVLLIQQLSPRICFQFILKWLSIPCIFSLKSFSFFLIFIYFSSDSICFSPLFNKYSYYGQHCCIRMFF